MRRRGFSFRTWGDVRMKKIHITGPAFLFLRLDGQFLMLDGKFLMLGV